MGGGGGGGLGSIVDNTLGTNLFGDNASDRALNAQGAASQEANRTLKSMYDKQVGDQEAFKQAGYSALDEMQNRNFQRDFTQADFQQDPGYQFRMGEGMKALERSAAARGGLNSGATLKALTRYGQDFATNEYQNAYNRFNADRDRRFNRLSSIANMGQQSLGQLGQAAQNYGTALSGNQLDMGNARASYETAKGQRQADMVKQGVQAGMAFSDERLKTNVTPVSKEDLQEMKKHLKPYAFTYINDKHGQGEWVGVMAQDLEKSKLGKTLVVEDENGHKMVDMKKVMSLFLATMAEG